MTEAEWLGCGDPWLMLGHLTPNWHSPNGVASCRKLRLASCSFCRRIWHLLTDVRSKNVVEVAERHADGLVGDSELLAADADAELVGTANWNEMDGHGAIAAWYVTADTCYCLRNPTVRSHQEGPLPSEVAREAGDAFAYSIAQTNEYATFGGDLRDEHLAQCHLLRDIFGNPFRPVAFDPAWRTATVTALAQAIYDDRRFADLPILADALEDAGCADGDVLRHCRMPGEHVRGCWVVDLALGKE